MCNDFIILFVACLKKIKLTETKSLKCVFFSFSPFYLLKTKLLKTVIMC